MSSTKYKIVKDNTGLFYIISQTQDKSWWAGQPYFTEEEARSVIKNIISKNSYTIIEEFDVPDKEYK